jgi:hypothetical protein
VGTATQDYESGSVEEIERLLKRGVRVLIYFCERDIPQATLTDDQFQKLRKLRRGFGKLTAAIPDVRVSVSGGVSVRPDGSPLHMMIISVENHSPVKVYISRVVIQLDVMKSYLLRRIF